jgi:type II/IV secretion system protein
MAALVSERLKGSAYLPNAEQERKVLFGYGAVIRSLCKEIFAEGIFPLQGLLVVAGSTKSGKSNITRGLIAEYLSTVYDQHGGKDPPRLLTYEDPIEVPLFRDEKSPIDFDFGRLRQDLVSYTPREKGGDVRNLRQAIRDALRQTPTVFYVGEVRDGQEWREILDFAGTGHFVVVTTHAGSLAELMSKLLHEAHAHTAAERGYYAGRLVGLVHLSSLDGRNPTDRVYQDRKTGNREEKPMGQVGKAFHAENVFGNSCAVRGTVPALWRRSGEAVPRLVNDYLSSLLPRFLTPDFSGTKPAKKEIFMLGRSYFVQNLINWCVAEGSRNSVSEALLPVAIRADLKGE